MLSKKRIFILFLRKENTEKEEEESAHEEKSGNTVFSLTCSSYISLLGCLCIKTVQLLFRQRGAGVYFCFCVCFFLIGFLIYCKPKDKKKRKLKSSKNPLSIITEKNHNVAIWCLIYSSVLIVICIFVLSSHAWVSSLQSAVLLLPDFPPKCLCYISCLFVFHLSCLFISCFIAGI